MFAGLTAWFSTNVSRNKKKQWADGSGTEKSLDDAQFIFSQNATSLDTLRVFQSEAYLDEHLSVFHPNYISQCVKKGDRNQVVLGKYYFPPADVQELARKQMQYEWDLDGNLSDSSSEDEPTTIANRKPNKKMDPKSSPSKNHKSNTQKKDVTIKASQPSTSKDEPKLQRKSPRTGASKNAENSTRKVQNNTEKTVAMEISSPNKIQELEKGKKQASTHRSSAKKNYMSNTLPQNSEFDRIEGMAVVSGELHDFIVGQNGCDLVKVS